MAMIFIDTEYNRTTHPSVNPVCAVTYRLDKKSKQSDKKRWWVHNNLYSQALLAKYLTENKEDTMLCYNAVAEGRFFISLGLNPMEFKWIDLYIEYKYISNNNDEVAYGDQLVNGKVKKTKRPPPKWQRTEEDSKTAFKQTFSLSEATFKLTGEIRDSEHKDKMRDLIISDPESFTQQEREDILNYCDDDTVFLPQIWDKIKKHIEKLHRAPLTGKELQEIYLRGEYSAATALMESWGYPINVEKTRNFSSSVGPLLEQAQREINKLFPNISPFVYNRKERRFSLNEKRVRDWIAANCDVESWKKTDGYKDAKKKATKESPANPANYTSLSLEAWERAFPFKHEYPEDNFGAQMVRYLKLKQSMNGFVPGGKKNFWDAVGPDGNVRCFLNPYGTATSRNAVGSTSFLFLKPAWMRSLAEPPPGEAMGAFDYGSEEYLISALHAKCKPMIDSYASGDVYLAFAKMAGIVPQSATKESHKFERDLCKALVLSLSYLQTAKGLAEKLCAQTGKYFSEDQAQEYIDNFYEVYKELEESQQEAQELYADQGYLRLPCGWRVWGDCDNFRSTTNFPIQGRGGSILRRAIITAIKDYGLKPVVPLHDAVYIRYPSDDLGHMDRLHKAMREAFAYYFDDKKSAALIKLDGFTWSKDFPPITYNEKGRPIYPEITTPGGLELSCGDLYLDERAVDEYKKFSKYFNYREEQSL